MLRTLDFTGSEHYAPFIFLLSTALNDLHQLDRPLIWLQDSKSPIFMLLQIHGIV